MRMIVCIILLVPRVSLRTVGRVSVKYQILMTHCLFQHLNVVVWLRVNQVRLTCPISYVFFPLPQLGNFLDAINEMRSCNILLDAGVILLL